MYLSMLLVNVLHGYCMDIVVVYRSIIIPLIILFYIQFNFSEFKQIIHT